MKPSIAPFSLDVKEHYEQGARQNKHPQGKWGSILYSHFTTFIMSYTTDDNYRYQQYKAARYEKDPRQMTEMHRSIKKKKKKKINTLFQQTCKLSVQIS